VRCAGNYPEARLSRILGFVRRLRGFSEIGARVPAGLRLFAFRPAELGVNSRQVLRRGEEFPFPFSVSRAATPF
jgi:hypothetical protein